MGKNNFMLVESFEHKVKLNDWIDAGKPFILTKTRGLDHLPERAPKEGLPDYCSQDLAEWSLLKALQLLRREKQNRNKPHSQCVTGERLAGKKVVVVGSMGATGRAVTRLFKAVGCEVAGYDLLDKGNTSLRELYKDAKIIVICVTGNKKNIIKDYNFDEMRNKPILINPLGRHVVTVASIKRAFNSGKIGGYAFDDQLGLSPFAKHFLVEWTPHTGALTKEAQFSRNVEWKKLLKKHGVKE